jgi:hypothetical protein
MTIEMNVAPNKLSGSSTMKGQSKPIDADPGGALFADGAGTYEVIASLPLADGYSLSFRNFDLNKQKPQIKQLKVVGTESVTVRQVRLTPTKWRSSRRTTMPTNRLCGSISRVEGF